MPPGEKWYGVFIAKNDHTADAIRWGRISVLDVATSWKWINTFVNSTVAHNKNLTIYKSQPIYLHL